MTARIITLTDQITDKDREDFRALLTILPLLLVVGIGFTAIIQGLIEGPLA